MRYPLYVTFEETDDEVIAYCDEINAVASGSTKEEAENNLREAIKTMLAEYGDEVGAGLKEKVLTFLEVA